jgi:hypothetical protein
MKKLALTLALICVAGMSGRVCAELVNGLSVERSSGDLGVLNKLTGAIGGPASDGGDADDDQHNATGAKPGSEQAVRDRQATPSPAGRAEKPPLLSVSQAGEGAKSPAAAASVAGDSSLHQEIKEAVRPLYDDLKGAGVVEGLHDLKSGLGLSGATSFNERTPSDDPQDPANIAAREAERAGNPSAAPALNDRPRTAAQIERDKLANSILMEQLIDELKPWLFGVIGLYMLWRMIKMGFAYAEWKANRPVKRRSRSSRHRGGTTRS